MYDEHILLRTWFALRERTAVAVPDDLQGLVDFVYADTTVPPADAGTELAERWRATKSALEAKQRDEEAQARLRRLDTPSGSRSIERYLTDPRDEDEDLHPALQH